MSIAPRLPRRALLGGLGAIAVGSALTACGSEQAAPPAAPTGPSLASPTPATDGARLDRFITQVHDAIAAADKAKDPKKLAPRVVGSAVEFRTRTYEMIGKAEAWASQLSLPGSEVLVPMTSVGEDFPRAALALVADSQKDGIPYFVALQQKDARSPYATWGWARQAVGITMPKVENQSVGAAPVAGDDDSLILAPAAAIALYAKVLSDGSAADPKQLLAADPYMTKVHEQIQTERKDINTGVQHDEAATIKEVYTVRKGEYAGLHTDDGGAIVMATLDSTRRLTLRNGATLTTGDELKDYTDLIGEKRFTKEFVRTYGTTIALYIPTRDSGGKIQPIGATRYALGASGS